MQQAGSGKEGEQAYQQASSQQQYAELRQQQMWEYEQKYQEWLKQWEQWHEWEQEQRQAAIEKEIWDRRLEHELKRDKEVGVSDCC